MIQYVQHSNKFIWRGPFEQRFEPMAAGFEWSDQDLCWFTQSPYKAFLMDPRNPGFEWIRHNIRSSKQREPMLDVPAPEGLVYYPFQAAGIEHMAGQVYQGRRFLLCADEQGLGKTIQAIGLANWFGFKKILVICPASLRLNWVAELKKWHLYSEGVGYVKTGKDIVPARSTVVTSYNLVEVVADYNPDMIIIDEGHYLKNHESQRTRKILGDGRKQKGLVNKALTVALTGTPLPNGRPNELWPILYRGAPDVIDAMRYYRFLSRFCNMYEDDDGMEKITGARNHTELYARLRGSGFMVRRLKKDVLTELPPKTYKMVVFPGNAATAKVILKESQFSAAEIVAHGVPAGTPLPEIRREMGVAKAPICCSYIDDLLHGGCDKVVVFARHIEVVAILKERLAEYNWACIDGSTPQKKRKAEVDRFQEDPLCRVFIGSEAAEEGWTLTAAHDMVMVEPEWVPGKNDQRADRLHRIGQKHGVLIHLLVVEESLDAKILQAAANKTADIDQILNIGG